MHIIRTKKQVLGDLKGFEFLAMDKYLLVLQMRDDKSSNIS